MNNKDKLQEATIKILRENEQQSTITQFKKTLLEYLRNNIQYDIDSTYKDSSTSITFNPLKGIDIVLEIEVNENNIPYAILMGGPIYHYSYYDTQFYASKFDKLIVRINSLIEKSKAYIKRSNKPTNLKWTVIDKNPLTYQAKKYGYLFNIYYQEEDKNYGLTVDYKDQELQQYDNYFNSLEDAKKEVERILKEDPRGD